jgi:hypothetical protein
LAAKVVRAVRRVGAYDHAFPPARDELVAGACRQNDHVSGFDHDVAAALAAEVVLTCGGCRLPLHPDVEVMIPDSI